ncbi:30S ribosomal protein S2 [Rathayibacter tanaceti]|uniref:Small ribosomal subunit protein uS2 n=1 Tax=Rathayibacter tanaceti TaxID=1671680 RepID=A0A166HV93_9MICO|nr:30S ribosomal protein S2 [Rathayibacter tanaceti]
MAVVTMRQLLDSGVHFGHQTRRWNPKMKRFILTERSGSYIIDLQQSLAYIDKTYDFVKETVAHGGTILFVGTKKQAQNAISEQATRVGQPYVNQRWLGGLLTNFQTVSKRLARMKELEELDFDDTSKSGFTKKELLIKKRELDKLHKSLGGIRNLSKTPSALWVVDTKKEHLAIDEAKKLGIPVIGILDTNCDPDEVQYPIPGNDDAIRSVSLLTRIVADAAAEGLIQRHQKPEPRATSRPSSPWPSGSRSCSPRAHPPPMSRSRTSRPALRPRRSPTPRLRPPMRPSPPLRPPMRLPSRLPRPRSSRPRQTRPPPPDSPFHDGGRTRRACGRPAPVTVGATSTTSKNRRHLGALGFLPEAPPRRVSEPQSFRTKRSSQNHGKFQPR